MNAEILSIGTELLVGQIVNTNAAFLARELAQLGIDLFRVTAVGDNLERLVGVLQEAAARAELVICTGGLGPTPDDLTIEALAVLGKEALEIRPDAAARLEELFKRRHRVMTPTELKQAYFPPSAELIPNPAGTALGAAVTKDGALIMAFPGVPHELEAMWRTWAIPRLVGRSQGILASRLLKFAGASETAIAERVKDLLAGANPSVAPYTGSYEIHLRLSAKAKDLAAADALLDPVEREILARVGEFYFGRDDQTLAHAVGQRLRDSRMRLSTAESMTGGLLASRLTDVPGASEFFAGGFVVYTIDQKAGLLGVDPEVITRYTDVSAEVSTELARRVRQLTKTDWGIGITGYAGPGPQVAPEDVGRVFVALAGPEDRSIVQERRLGPHPRDRVKLFATQVALALLFRQLAPAGTPASLG